MAYRDNVQLLCERLSIANPIEEKDITIQSIIFRRIPGFLEDFRVEATDMNRGGRLLAQYMVIHGDNDSLQLDSTMRTYARKFFTYELWDDCSADKRPLVYGFKHARSLTVVRKVEGT